MLGSLLLAAGASAGSGGVGAGGDGGQQTTTTGDCERSSFGDRSLRVGDCGRDVKTLHWILGSKRYASVSLNKKFRDRTDETVRLFQRRQDLPTNGVVSNRTRRRLVRSMSREIATWYGPGFYGNTTACGKTLQRSTVGVAHRTLPCGSRVTVKYRGRFLRTRVIDRGPYANNANWDLTERAAKKLRMTATSKVRVAVVR